MTTFKEEEKNTSCEFLVAIEAVEASAVIPGAGEHAVVKAYTFVKLWQSL